MKSFCTILAVMACFVATAQSDNGNHVGYDVEPKASPGFAISEEVRKKIAGRVGKLKEGQEKLNTLGGGKVHVHGPSDSSRAQVHWEECLRQITQDHDHVTAALSGALRENEFGLLVFRAHEYRQLYKSNGYSSALLGSASAFLKATQSLFDEPAGEATRQRIVQSIAILKDVLASLTEMREIQDAVSPDKRAKTTLSKPGKPG